MTRRIPQLLAVIVAFSTGSAAHAQHNEVRGAGPGAGHFPGGPPRGPQPARQAAPVRGQAAMPPPQQQRPQAPPAMRGEGGPQPHHAEPERPHVDRGAHWTGHESGPHDVRYHVDHPWANGRFRQPMGRGHVYRINGWDAPRRRFWFANSFFVVAEPDWAYAGDWNWGSDQVVLYDDPDHPGWYLAYNVRLGTYVHVQYDGAMQ
jgi:hypothetical protein